MTTLRFIIDLDQQTAFNMAADQYLLNKCTELDTIFVRFYSWKNPTITLGYMQNAQDTLLIDKLKKDSLSWIRRPTGGRAVLHWDDLTYSVIFPKSFTFMGTTVKESYAAITRCLIDGLTFAGIKCTTHDSYDQLLAVKREVKLPCFLAPNRDEIMVNGKKLIGSAQKRVSNSVLQHGSIPISQRPYDLPEYLNIERKDQFLQKQLLKDKSICLQDINSQLRIDHLIKFIEHGFLENITIPNLTKNWTDAEISEIHMLSDSQDFITTWMR